MHSNVHLSRSKAPFAMLVALFLALALAGPAQASDSASDSTSEPQPISRADSNDGGANGQCTEGGAESDGPYCSTRDGSASENGNGDGEATGKPCAGCVGKADNKNPHGQNPNADEDGNNGYECDDNNGVGKGNPAHTACDEAETTTSDEPDSSDETDETIKPDETDETIKPDDADNSDQPDDAAVELEAPSTVAGVEITGVELEAQTNANQAATVAAAQAARTAPLGLPQTGASDSLLMLLLAGLAMAGIGGTTMLYRRRTATNS